MSSYMILKAQKVLVLAFFSLNEIILRVQQFVTVISGRLPAGNLLIFPQTVVGAGYRKVRVM